MSEIQEKLSRAAQDEIDLLRRQVDAEREAHAATKARAENAERERDEARAAYAAFVEAKNRATDEQSFMERAYYLACQPNPGQPLLNRLAELEAHVKLAGEHYDEERAYRLTVEAKLAALEAENARLRAVVERLPKTADGVPITPDMELFCCEGHVVAWRDYHLAEVGCDEAECIIGGSPDEADHPSTYPFSECYSTRAAAEAAKEKK